MNVKMKMPDLSANEAKIAIIRWLIEPGQLYGSKGARMEFSGCLQVPVVRVASPDVPVPFAPVLENAYRPDPARIVEGVQQFLKQ